MGIRKEEIRRRTRTEIRLCVQEGGDPTQDSDGDLTSLFVSSVAHLVAHRICLSLSFRIICRTSSRTSFYLGSVAHLCRTSDCRISVSHLSLSCAPAHCAASALVSGYPTACPWRCARDAAAFRDGAAHRVLDTGGCRCQNKIRYSKFDVRSMFDDDDD